MTDAATRAAAEAAVRVAYGRLVAWLARQWRDIAAAEDALADALEAALRVWPVDGVPTSPEGWLLTAAKRNLLKAARRRRLADDPAVTILFAGDEAAALPPDVPDERLRLMFVCAHPAIDASVRAALMLQVVLGLDAARIARGFVVPTETMAKRLVRAKARIRDAAIRFEEPELRELPGRLDGVLEAIYGAYTLGRDGGDESAGARLTAEARFLAELVVARLPDEPEALGLLALIEACDARRHAAVDAHGAWVALDDQDTRRWDDAAIDRASLRLGRAARLKRVGPLQLEAAIQLAHCARRRGGATPWPDIRRLYEVLLASRPTIGARLGHVLASVHAGDDVSAALVLLERIDVGVRSDHQPWWAARAHLLALAGRHAEAAEALRRAIDLARSDTLRRALRQRLTMAG